MSILTHYGLTVEEYASKQGKHVSCFDPKAPHPLCSNGSYHVKTTRLIKDVDCPVCLERVAKMPHIHSKQK